MIRIAQSSTMWWHPCSIHSSSTSWISSWSHSYFRRVKHLVNFHCWNNFDICHELCHRCSSIGWQVQSSIDTLRDRNDCIPGCFSWVACWCWLHESCKSFCPSCCCFWWVSFGLTWVSSFYSEWNAHWIWWFGEIVGACLAVVIERMVFAPIYTSCENDSNSPIWWWRIYLLYKDPNRKVNKRRKNFTSWATAFNKHKDTNREVHYAETTAELAAPWGLLIQLECLINCQFPSFLVTNNILQ